MRFPDVYKHSKTLLILDLIIIFLGMTVIFGWEINNKAIVQLFSGFAAMQFNTAVCFVLCGLAIISSRMRYEAISKIFSGLIFIISLLTLIEYFFGIDLGVDTLFETNYFNNDSYVLGRMSPNTAVCFLFVSMALRLHARAVKTQTDRLPLTCVAFSIFILATLSLISYLQFIPQLIGWGSITKMSLHTTLGLIIVSASLIMGQVFIIRKYRAKEYFYHPIIIFILSTIIFTTVSYISALNEQRTLGNSVALQSKSLANELNITLNQQFAALSRISSRWEQHGGTEKEDWDADVYNYYHDMKVFQAIKWIDQEYILRWIFPIVGNEQLIDKRLADDAIRRNDLENAKLDDGVTISAPFTLAQGKMGFYVYCPIYINNQFNGFTVGQYRVDKLFDKIIRAKSQDKFYVAIEISGKKAYGNLDDYMTGNNKPLLQNVSFNIHDTEFTLLFLPKRDYMLTYLTVTPLIILVLGVIISLLLAYTLLLLKRSRLYYNALEDEQNDAKSFYEKLTNFSEINSINADYHESPYSIFSGDLLLVARERHDNACVHIMLVDMTGHGLGAAIGLIPITQIFYEKINQGESKEHILSAINAQLKKILPEGKYAAAAYCYVNADKKSFQYWTGGIPPIKHFIQKQNQLINKKTKQLPLGYLKEDAFDAYFETSGYEVGDKLYLYSDGILEVPNDKGELFGLGNLDKAILSHSNGAGVDTIFKEVQDYAINDFQDDDMTLLALTLE